MKHLLFITLIFFTPKFILAQKDPFANYVKNEPKNYYSQAEKEKMTKYPKFDNFLKQKLDFSVPIISVQQLKELRQENPSLIVLDTRSEIAYETSHIPEAKRVGYTDFSIERVWMLPRDAEIVVYCTVGWKSEQVGKYLENMGFTNIKNLYGSIVEWVNEGGVVIDKDNKATQKVVVGDKEKKQYLKKGRAIVIEESEVPQ